MIRAQIQFEETQYEEIRNRAHDNRTSIAEIVRRLVRSGLRNDSEEDLGGPRAEELLTIAGIGRSGLADLGREHDAYLAEDFDA